MILTSLLKEPSSLVFPCEQRRLTFMSVENSGTRLTNLREQSRKLMLKAFWAKTHVTVVMTSMFTCMEVLELTYVEKKQVSLKALKENPVALD